MFAVGCSDEAFTNSGFRNWKHGSGKTGKLAKHAKSRMHLLSLERMQNFKTMTPVDIQLNEAAREMRERKERERFENRHIVGVIFDIVCHLQRWSPRGQILKSLALASRPQVLENWPVLGSRTALFFELLKFCGALENFFGKRFFVEIA